MFYNFIPPAGGGGDGFLLAENNLSDVDDPEEALKNLLAGLGATERSYLFFDGTEWGLRLVFEQKITIGPGEETQAINVSGLAADGMYILIFVFRTKYSGNTDFFPNCFGLLDGVDPGSSAKTVRRQWTGAVDVTGESDGVWGFTSLNDNDNFCQIIGSVKFQCNANESPLNNAVVWKMGVHDPNRSTGNQRFAWQQCVVENPTDFTSFQFWLDDAEATFEEKSYILVQRIN